MAFGLSPKYVQQFPLEELTPEQFLVMALEAAKKIGWNIGFISEQGFTAYTSFSLSSYSEEIKVTIDNEVATIKSECTGNQLADWGKNKRNINDFDDAFIGLRYTITPEEHTQKWEALKENIISLEETNFQQATATKEKITDIFSIFKPVQGYFITPVLINLNILLFTIMAISGVSILSPDSESLIRWGANFRPVTLEGQWWRLITCCFLHIGILHLLMNMYALVYIGLLLEPHLGKGRFAAAYLLTGIAASLTSLCWHDLTISAGASGAIFGMYGVFLAMLTTNLIEKSARKALLASIGIFVVYNLANGIKGNIDNAAHIGGLISGLIIGYIFYPGLKNPAAVKLKYAPIGLMTILVLSVSFVVLKKIPNDLGKYDSEIKKFVSMEQTALQVFRLPQNAPKEKILSGLKENGIYYWEKCIKLISDIDRLNLPEAIHSRNKKLITYCELRIKSYDLIYKTVSEDTQQYTEEVQEYNRKIENIINGLKE